VFGTVYDFLYDLALGNIITEPTIKQMNANNIQIPIMLVQFDAQYYNGPSFLCDIPKIVSITTVDCDVKWGTYVILQIIIVHIITIIIYKQLLLCIGYATTIHKVQDLTMDKIETGIGGILKGAV
jgi:hypothetical protein